jgi:hypothetical protein
MELFSFEGHMSLRRSNRASIVMMTALLLLAVLLSACQSNRPTVIAPADVTSPTDTPVDESESAPEAAASLTPPPTSTPTPWQNPMPSTWTPLPTQPLLRPTSTPWPQSTINARLTLVAGTTVAPGYGCKKNANAVAVFTNRAWEPGWCEVRGGWTSFYEYNVYYPEGWVPNTFGDYYPNLAFNVGQPNIDLRIYQVFAYGLRSFDGKLEDAPEQAVQCTPDGDCVALVNQLEKFISQETRKMVINDVLIVDSEYGQLLLHRYFFYVPFRVGNKAEDRLFVVELSAAKDYIHTDKYNLLIQQVDRMVGSLMQR